MTIFAAKFSRRGFLGGASALGAAASLGVGTDASAAAAPDQPRLPEPDPEHCFYLMPIADDFAGGTPEQFRTEMQKMIEQLGGQNLYQRLGFSFIPRGRDQLMSAAGIAQDLGVSIGVIMPYQCHSGGAQVTPDLRTYQWRMDGVTWHGAASTDARDWNIPSPARYNRATRDLLRTTVQAWAADVKAVMAAFPGVITVINGVIEEELATGGQQDQYLADYSPFAIAEFRDWLRHRGEYDADGGRYAGQGAPQEIVGRFSVYGGKLRSPFYSDPAPDTAGPGQRSFNDHFGTGFRTWQLQYWDLDRYPDPITDPSFDPTPQSGPGAIAGGFDAPRVRDAAAAFWNAWSWDYPDHENSYPPGNPDRPAFGFRQFEVHHFVLDMFDVLVEAGLPRGLMFAHQIPGEVVSGDGMGAGAPRCRSSASPLWTGYLPMNDHLGITRFGPIDPALVRQYSDNWGIFEWHPDPGADPAGQELYDTATHDLDSYFAGRAHVLFPGWWVADGGLDPTFPLNDSRFAVAIKDFLDRTPDVPYSDRPGVPVTYSPPPVQGLSVTATDSRTDEVTWSRQIWPDHPDAWSGWRQFDSFEIEASTGTQRDVRLTRRTSATFVDRDRYERYRVRARATTGLLGPWRDAVPSGGSV